MLTRLLLRGMTYPQLGPITLESFTTYYYSGGTIIVGLVSGADETEEEGAVADMQDVTVEEVRAGRDWKTCLGGFYYVSARDGETRSRG